MERGFNPVEASPCLTRLEYVEKKDMPNYSSEVMQRANDKHREDTPDVQLERNLGAWYAS